MESIKTVQQQNYEGAIYRLENLIKDKEIAESEYEDIRSTLSSILNSLKTEFKLGQNNSEFIHQLEDKLCNMNETKLHDRRFESFRSALGRVITIFNHELE